MQHMRQRGVTTPMKRRSGSLALKQDWPPKQGIADVTMHRENRAWRKAECSTNAVQKQYSTSTMRVR
eukprot:331328-Pleurochrysis_carterae.AAC.1